jgi:transcriptional regulator with XRE-family HTH domain
MFQDERTTTTRGNPQDAAEKGRQRDIGAVAGALGTAIREERRRRRLTIADVARTVGLSFSEVQAVESGRVASLDTYLRLAKVLHLQPSFELVDPRRRETVRRKEDPVHAAMGESQAAQLASLGYEVRIDEPFQHYQFAGRGDLVAWSVRDAVILHIENRTEFPNIQQGFGAFNTKREYLGLELASRVGVRRWRSESHVMAAIWSADVIHTIRQHRATFGSLGPGGPSILETWCLGEAPPDGRKTGFVLFDPVDNRRSDARRWVGVSDLAKVRPRYRGYADVLAALKDADQA